ncbi:MAG: hypothetical protein HOJ35_06290 [Bdellovibrionales bacterium]|nr:hypothetical protein [Bdellovibrionales bacterium]
MSKCIKFIHLDNIKLVVCVLLVGFFPFSESYGLTLSDLQHKHFIPVPDNTFVPIKRIPANFIPDDELEIIPIDTSIWIDDLMIEDDAGVMEKIKKNMAQWKEREEYIKTWDIEEILIYDYPSIREQRKYLSRKMLRYLDKRLSGEIKKAEKGTMLARVGKVQKALKPKAEAQLSEQVKLKFKARVLRGRAYMVVDNPYIDYETMVSASGHVEMTVQKRFTAVGLKTKLQYNIDRDEWITSLDKRIARHVTARISSLQDDRTMMFENDADKTIEFLFNRKF